MGEQKEAPGAGGRPGAAVQRILSGVLAPIIPQNGPLFTHRALPHEGDPLPESEHMPARALPAAPSEHDRLTRAALAGELGALSSLIDQATARAEKHQAAAAWHTEQAQLALDERERLEQLIPAPSDQEGGQ